MPRAYPYGIYHYNATFPWPEGGKSLEAQEISCKNVSFRVEPAIGRAERRISLRVEPLLESEPPCPGASQERFFDFGRREAAYAQNDKRLKSPPRKVAL